MSINRHVETNRTELENVSASWHVKKLNFNTPRWAFFFPSIKGRVSEWDIELQFSRTWYNLGVIWRSVRRQAKRRAEIQLTQSVARRRHRSYHALPHRLRAEINQLKVIRGIGSWCDHNGSKRQTFVRELFIRRGGKNQQEFSCLKFVFRKFS